MVVEGGLRDVRDLSRLREGEEARREAREWREGAEGGEEGGLVWVLGRREGEEGDGEKMGEEGEMGGWGRYLCWSF